MSEHDGQRAAHDSEIIADFRRTYEQLVKTEGDHTSPNGKPWSMRLTLEEMTALLRAVDERDELRRQGVGDFETGFDPITVVTIDRELDHVEVLARGTRVGETGRCAICGVGLIKLPGDSVWRHNAPVPPLHYDPRHIAIPIVPVTPTHTAAPCARTDGLGCAGWCTCVCHETIA